jgi:hypothetical protein
MLTRLLDFGPIKRLTGGRGERRGLHFHLTVEIPLLPLFAPVERSQNLIPVSIKGPFSSVLFVKPPDV